MAAQPQTTLPLHRLDIETYNKIVAAGALEGQHVELLDGVLAEMSPHSPAHATVIRRLARQLPADRLQAQLPLEVSPNSEPEPDLAVLAEEPPPDRHPQTAELVIEVAVTSQMIDRNVKAPLYACASIPTYWLIDVPARIVEVRTSPGPNGYRHCETFREGDSLPSPLQGVANLDVATLLRDVST